jgi:hypothetical protein
LTDEEKLTPRPSATPTHTPTPTFTPTGTTTPTPTSTPLFRPDTDNDGIPDDFEDVNENGDVEDDDTDGDGVPNYLDSDDDGDGIPTEIETGELDGGLPHSARDSDGDGTPDFLDDDDDGDGTPTQIEGVSDHNRNGVPDYLDGHALVALYLPYSSHAKPTSTPTSTPPAPQIERTIVYIAAPNDDVEERHDGLMDFDSTDLELVEEDGPQVVGLRYQNVPVPQGATIVDAFLVFDVDESSSKSADLLFHSEASDNAAEFHGRYDVSERLRTAASVSWNNVPPWNHPDEIYLSPGLAPIVSEVVNRGGWQSGNAMVFIITGKGRRVAKSYENEAGSAPILYIDYMR